MDVLKMLFGDVDPATKVTPRWCTDEADWQKTAMELAEQVFSDIERRCPKGTSLKQIVEEFQSRYYYCASDNVMLMTESGQVVSAQGWGMASQGLFFGVDPKALNELEQLELEEEALNKRHRQETTDFINTWLTKKGVKVVATYEEPEWNAYRKEYDKAQVSLYKRSKIYKSFQSKQWNERQVMWNETKKARIKVAKADAVAMMAAYKKAFFANFEYGDNHGDVSGDMGTVLEHGNVWDNIPHVKINHH